MSIYLPRLSQVKNWLCDMFRHSSQWVVLGRSWTLDIKPLDVTEISRVSGNGCLSLRRGMCISNILKTQSVQIKYIYMYITTDVWKPTFKWHQMKIWEISFGCFLTLSYFLLVNSCKYVLKSTDPLSGKSGNSSLSFKAIGFGWANPPNSEPLDEMSISSDRELS